MCVVGLRVTHKKKICFFFSEDEATITFLCHKPTPTLNNQIPKKKKTELYYTQSERVTGG